MAFSCSYVLSQLRADEPDKNGEASQAKRGTKRPFPFSGDKEENVADDILPEAVDVLDSIFASLCPFSENSSASDDVVIVHETKSASSGDDEPEIEIVKTVNGIENSEVEIISEETDNQLQIVNDEEIYDFTNIPVQVTGAWKEFMNGKGNNYTKGCKWAPDGSCIMTCSDDNILRLFNLPEELWDCSKWHDITEMEAVVKISEGEILYDYSWYPLMNSSEPSTCCLASCSKNTPVHLWDGFTGELRASYRSYDQMDEIIAARSLSFDSEGQRIFCGFEKTVRIFNVDLPGRNFEIRNTFAKKSGQSGIISCFAFTPQNRHISAVGSYQKSIGLYSEPDGELECILEGQKGGVTQLQFSPDGNLLYSGGRKDPEILCWDLRNLGTVLYCLRRTCVTNQRMYFDITRGGRYIVSGNNNGIISVWDTYKEPKETETDDFDVLEPTLFYMGHKDCVNGISLHPTYPLLCSSSGQRKFRDLLPEDDDELFARELPERDNSLRLWWIGKSS
ncbi:telomerase Cajal body protein 1-like [Argiope bruennichi]|uniref:WD repeat-containing protein 79 n=1 Tax=Argiope bruennichi TaxID=94029 RepID=A0A8T0G4V7_ARGBR|nr:telomerase Cajal body protein 1-like [Argiope bruennichi]KAF8796899.1 Telomerase Cajal body protein 1 like protein [Argiope bruennichi]